MATRQLADARMPAVSESVCCMSVALPSGLVGQSLLGGVLAWDHSKVDLQERTEEKLHFQGTRQVRAPRWMEMPSPSAGLAIESAGPTDNK